MRLLSAASSHVGLVRRQNEDSFVVGGGIFAVCDGMGGARAGEVASEAACRALIRLPEAGVVDPMHLERAVHEANADIVAQSRRDRGLHGMGTTMTAAVATPTGLAFVHVGDSRAYHLRGGALNQVTDDHSLVAELVRRGQLTPAQAAVHPHRSIITRALGTEDTVDPDVFEISLEPDDRVLFCSDGLSGMVPDEKIEEVLLRPDSPQAAADALVQAALEGGGEDNITVVVVDVVSDDHPGAASDDIADDDTVTLGPADRGAERLSSVPGFMRPALGMGARLGRRPPIWARPAPDPASAAQGAGGRVRWSRRRWIVTAAVVVVVLALAIAAFAVFNSNVYYVGNANGMVALYQGLPIALLGIHLSSVVELGTVSYDSLAAYQRERVDAHDLVGKEDGQAFLRGLATLQ